MHFDTEIRFIFTGSNLDDQALHCYKIFQQLSKNLQVNIKGKVVGE